MRWIVRNRRSRVPGFLSSATGDRVSTTVSVAEATPTRRHMRRAMSTENLGSRPVENASELSAASNLPRWS